MDGGSDPATAQCLFGSSRWQLSSARLQEAGGTDRKSILALQIHRQNAQSKQQRKFALLETNSQLCSFKACVYKSKPRLRRAFLADSPSEVPPAGLALPERDRAAAASGCPGGVGGLGSDEQALRPGEPGPLTPCLVG